MNFRVCSDEVILFALGRKTQWEALHVNKLLPPRLSYVKYLSGPHHLKLYRYNLSTLQHTQSTEVENRVAAVIASIMPNMEFIQINLSQIVLTLR